MKSTLFNCLTISFYTILSVVVGILFSHDQWLLLWLLACIVGNLVLGGLIYWLHKHFGTGRNDFFALKSLGNFFELIVYSFLIVFHIYTVLAGVLAIKAVGSIGDKKSGAEDNKDKGADDKRSVKIVSIYRLGFVLQLILAFVFAFILWQSDAYNDIKELHFFNVESHEANAE